ncbi:hypothetical protein ACFFQW_36465 [Umezawaea endophytica]|uniref:Uncharacterized protein n=1 Tax=Umezawaea endophytica TaxID=1654476 RepID=A0A9X3AFZ8_9PSEU|nr:hypothetical protein [Umezawaea endophytica]MCS7478951.1 hypothetical protein [Umezawaea endophytica]
MTDTPRPTASNLALKVFLRVVVSAVVGAALLLAWVAAFQSEKLRTMLDNTDLGEFILLLVIGLPVALLVSVLLAGPVLWILKVRPVWPIVLLGPVIMGIFQYFKLPDELAWVGGKWTVQAILAATSYGLAALLTAPAMLRKKK